MKVKDVLVIAVVAVATMLVALIVTRPAPLAIASQNMIQALTVAEPVLKADGVELTLKADKNTYPAGEKPVVSLKAKNTNDRDARVRVQVRMLAVAPASPYSRRVALPNEVWKDSLLVDLKPSEVRKIELPTGVSLPAGMDISFTVQVGDKIVRAAGFSVPALADGIKQPGPEAS